MLRLRDAGAGIVNLDPQQGATAAAAHQHAAVLGVFDGVGNEVLQHPAQQLAVGVERHAAGHDAEFQALLARGGAEFERQRLQDFLDAERSHLGLHGAGIELRNVEQRREDFLDRFERSIDIADKLAVPGAFQALHQARGEQPGGIERLQDVVTGGGDEPGLRQIGAVGLGLGVRQFGIEAGQFRRALGDPALERLVRALQGFRRHDACRRIDDGDDDAAIGHGTGADLQHLARVDPPFTEDFVGDGDALHPVAERRRAAFGARQELRGDLGQRRAEAVQVLA